MIDSDGWPNIKAKPTRLRRTLRALIPPGAKTATWAFPVNLTRLSANLEWHVIRAESFA
jgi:hypothetical protein